MGKLSIFLFLTILASVYNQCTIPRAQSYFKRSIYEFTVKLAGRISQDTDRHFIASGLSTWSLLSTLSQGATGDTLEELVRVLRMHLHPCFIKRYNQIINKLMNNTVLEHSSGILVDNTLGVRQDFNLNVKKAGVCFIEILRFEHALITATHVNDLVSKKTHDEINEIVSFADIVWASIVIIDALYFKSAWKIQFPYLDTEVSAFYDDKGNQVGDVNLMFVNGIFNVTLVPFIQAKVLEIPFEEDNKFSMLFYLPDTNVTIDNLIENLNRLSIRTIFELFKQHQPKNVSVKIPRFKLTSHINNWKELLMDIGLKRMFDRYQANFEALGSSPDLYVSNFIQKADIEITEHGSVASSVREGKNESKMLPDQFIADKPFVFIIVDRDTEFPLFIGAYSTPSIF